MTAATATAEKRLPKTRRESALGMTLRRLAKNKLALTGGVIFVLLCLAALFAPLIAPYGYEATDPALKYARPSLEHLFGCDQYGRDIFSRVIYGSRWSLTLGLSAAAISLVGGSLIGVAAGYFGGRVDAVVMRVIDVVQSIPNILLTIVLATALGNSFFNTVLAMSLSNMWGTARLIRGQAMRVRTEQYTEAAVATNNPSLRVVLKYVLPNSIQPVIINTCMSIGATIALASSLSFIGLGMQPPCPEWGAMLNDGRNYMRYYPNMLLAPGLMITLTVLSISLLGDGLRDAMDPRLKK